MVGVDDDPLTVDSGDPEGANVLAEELSRGRQDSTGIEAAGTERASAERRGAPDVGGPYGQEVSVAVLRDRHTREEGKFEPIPRNGAGDYPLDLVRNDILPQVGLRYQDSLSVVRPGALPLQLESY